MQMEAELGGREPQQLQEAGRSCPHSFCRRHGPAHHTLTSDSWPQNGEGLGCHVWPFIAGALGNKLSIPQLQTAPGSGLGLRGSHADA